MKKVALPPTNDQCETDALQCLCSLGDQCMKGLSEAVAKQTTNSFYSHNAYKVMNFQNKS